MQCSTLLKHHIGSLSGEAPARYGFVALQARLPASASRWQRSHKEVICSCSASRTVKTLAAAQQAETVQHGPLFTEADVQPVKAEDGKDTPFPPTPGVYAVLDAEGEVQYIGLSRKVSATVAGHARDLPELTHSVKVGTLEANAGSPGPSREALIGLWKDWMQQALEATGKVPPGNAKGNDTWVSKKAAARPEIKLTPGKGLDDLNCSITDLIEQVVKSNKVVAFVKGTRNEPQCGFSYKVLSMLNENGAQYEVVNVLDEVYNPGLREAIKNYSQWPTIPQVYVGGEFLGGCDILEEMNTSGELRKALVS